MVCNEVSSCVRCRLCLVGACMLAVINSNCTKWTVCYMAYNSINLVISLLLRTDDRVPAARCHV